MNIVSKTGKILILLWLVCVYPLMSQNTGQISGKVTSGEGEELPGATIQVQETKMATMTGADGTFSVKAQVGQHLIVSFLGMVTKQIKITSPVMNIQLEEDAHQLEGVVVTGYQKIRNRVFTGAASLVKLDDIKMEGIGDVSRLLEGRVAGLSIQNISGSFGSAPRINIRGGSFHYGQRSALMGH